jgi:hypothetical protein
MAGPRWLWLAAAACNPQPADPTQTVAFRDGGTSTEALGGNSGERGSVKITEVLWSGSVTSAGAWDPEDVFVELRNEGVRPLDLSGWRLALDGARAFTIVLPAMNSELDVDAHLLIAAKASGCFPSPDVVLPDLAFAYGDPLQLELTDADDRLIEVIGSREAAPFAGGYDGKASRSMERVQLMFGADGSAPHTWHFYTPTPVDVPNDDRVAASCRGRTLASAGRPNSPDYSGAFASGSLE